MAQDITNVFPPLRWLDSEENLFGVPCLDVRGLTRSLTAFTSDEKTAELFLQFRRSDGKEYQGQLPEGSASFECNLRYPFPKNIQNGPLFKAQQMEDKWDIYRFGNHLFFCRSWTGKLVLRAEINVQDEKAFVVSSVDANPNLGFGETGFVVSTVDFLIKSHIFGIDVPTHLLLLYPNDPVNALNFLMNEPIEFAKYMFHEFGRRAAFGSFSDTIEIPVEYDRSKFLERSNMLNQSTLKPVIHLSENKVDCPVQNCTHSVTRQKNHFRRSPEYQCPEHKIYISPSTFEYPQETDNLLWKSPEDLDLLKGIFSVKREHRMARDNSEDALTWNVFRYLERNNLLIEFLSSIHGQPLNEIETFYWTFDPLSNTVWKDLDTYREIFGEQPKRGSEPDVIVKTNEALFFIEVKLTAGHNTIPSNPAVSASYTSACHGWYQKVFQSDFNTVAVKNKKYELLRFWLLGSRMADRSDRAFYLMTVGRKSRSQTIQDEFGKLIHERKDRRFISTFWEGLYSFIGRFGPPILETNQVLAYMENKTIGYDRFGQLQKAFEL